jgi:hypothetical protein
MWGEDLMRIAPSSQGGWGVMILRITPYHRTLRFGGTL